MTCYMTKKITYKSAISNFILLFRTLNIIMQGLHWVIDCLRSKGVDPKVLDIGTGTGLLTMMAAKCGA